MLFNTNDGIFIGAFYFTAGNLSSKYRFQTSSIYLVTLVKAMYIGNYGMDSVLKPIVADVKKLVRIIRRKTSTTQNLYSQQIILTSRTTKVLHLSTVSNC